MDSEFIMFLLVLPNHFSGLPIMSPLDLLYRGHPDPVTSELVWLKWVRSKGSVIARKICM